MICSLYARNGKKVDTYDGAKTLDDLKKYLKTMRRGSNATEKKTTKTKQSNTQTKAKKKAEKQEL